MSEQSQLACFLRRWRLSAGFEIGQVAEALGYTSGAVRNWERGDRSGVDRIQALDDLYGARGALIDVARSLESPAVLPAQRTWWHNFTRHGGPIWAWIRPGGSSEIAIEATCGVLAFSLRRHCTRTGVMINCPFSIDNPPIRISFLNGKGWVDFGRGPVPDIGIQQVDAAHTLRTFQTTRQFLANLGDQSQYLRSFLASSEGEEFAGPVKWLLRNGEKAQRMTTRRGFTELTDAPGEALRSNGGHLSGNSMEQLRHARLMSVADVIVEDRKLVETSELGLEVLKSDNVARIEFGGTPRRVPYVRARLDTIYHGDGLTFREKLVESDVTERE